MDDRQLQPAPLDTSAPATAWLSTVQVPGPVPPTGFAAVARLLHPANDPNLNPVTWAHVATTTGHPLRTDSTFDDIAGTVHTRRTTHNNWSGGPRSSVSSATPAGTRCWTT